MALLLHKFIGAFRDMPPLDNDPKADSKSYMSSVGRGSAHLWAEGATHKLFVLAATKKC